MNSSSLSFETLKLDVDILESIIAPNARSRIEIGQSFIELFVGIDSKSRIEGLSIKHLGFDECIPYFSLIKKLVLSITAQEAYKLTWISCLEVIEEKDMDHPIFPLPLVLFRKAIDKYLGNPASFCQLKQIHPQNILCHCFGITSQDIEKKLKENNKNYDFINLQADLLISSGCGGCQENALNAFKTELVKSEAGIKLVAGHGLGYWCLWLHKQIKEQDLSLKVCEIKENKILLQGEKEDLCKIERIPEDLFCFFRFL